MSQAEIVPDDQHRAVTARVMELVRSQMHEAANDFRIETETGEVEVEFHFKLTPEEAARLIDG